MGTLWNFLKPGDTIDVIAPSSPPSDPTQTVEAIKKYFQNTSLKVRIPDGLIEPTPILNEANSIEKRVHFIKQAILAPDSSAVWIILGGAWGVELLDVLQAALPRNLSKDKIKPVIGYSDATALHVFFNQYFGWPSLHGIELGANGDIGDGWNHNKIVQMLDVLTGKTPSLTYPLEVLNPEVNFDTIETTLIGGNSLLINCLDSSTDFTVNTTNKTLFLESVARGSGEMSRFLNGLRYGGVAQSAQAILLGNFVVCGGHPNTPLEQQQLKLVRKYFSKHLNVPVLYTDIFGHGPINNPLPLLTSSTLVRTGKTTAQITVSVNQSRVS